MLDIEGVELVPGDICVAKGYNGITKVKIVKETVATVHLYYWNKVKNSWYSKSYVYKGASFCVFYKIGHEE